MQALQVPSPIAQYTLRGVPISIKRDDTIHDIISGNKWRKLKYVLQDAQQQGAATLVSFGGAYSNHLLALALAAKRSNMQAVGIVRGEEMPNNKVLAACVKYDMQLHYVSRTEYKNKTKCYEQIASHYPKPYAIPEGGASPHALKGVIEMMDELPQPYHHIALAIGTGTTFAGIQAALRATKTNTQLHGVLCLKADAASFVATTDLIAPLLNNEHIHDQYHHGGYAKSNTELLRFIEAFELENNHTIKLEPIYTGKVIWALHQLITQNIIPKNETILMIHTGGLYYTTP
jgi:1-aminocyclopropane-1-carboxylate deaminase